MAITIAARDRLAALGGFTAGWDAGVAVIDLALWAYCLAMVRKRVLR